MYIFDDIYISYRPSAARKDSLQDGNLLIKLSSSIPGVILLPLNSWGNFELKIHYWNCDVNSRAFIFINCYEFEIDVAFLATLRNFFYIFILIYSCLKR